MGSKFDNWVGFAGGVAIVFLILTKVAPELFGAIG